MIDERCFAASRYAFSTARARYARPIPTDHSASTEGPCQGPPDLASRADGTAVAIFAVLLPLGLGGRARTGSSRKYRPRSAATSPAVA